MCVQMPPKKKVPKPKGAAKRATPDPMAVDTVGGMWDRLPPCPVRKPCRTDDVPDPMAVVEAHIVRDSNGNSLRIHFTADDVQSRVLLPQIVCGTREVVAQTPPEARTYVREGLVRGADTPSEEFEGAMRQGFNDMAGTLWVVPYLTDVENKEWLKNPSKFKTERMTQRSWLDDTSRTWWVLDGATRRQLCVKYKLKAVAHVAYPDIAYDEAWSVAIHRNEGSTHQVNATSNLDKALRVRQLTGDKMTHARYVGNGLFTLSNNATEATEEPVREGGLVADQKTRKRLASSGDIGAWTKISYDMNKEAYIGSYKGINDTMMSVEIASIEAASLPTVLAYYDVTLMNPRVLAGLFLGVMMVFLFCAMTMNAVGRAAYAMMHECRRQFEIMKKGFKANGMSDEEIADPLKWPFEVTVDNHSYPDYSSCVSISTTRALREMVIPSVMAVVIPIVIGVILGVAGVMGMLAGTLVCGFAVAIFMANAGGAWDNAKKYIETGKHGGKGSDAHKAGVVGDTVGDPFKDTSGPALNILIKLVSIVSVVFAGLTVKVSPFVLAVLGLG